MTTENEPSAQGGKVGAVADASPTLRRKVLGLKLRRLREAAEITPVEAGAELEVSDSTIYRIEKGGVGIKPRDVEALLKLYGVTDEDEIEYLKQLAREGKQRGWWAKHRRSIPIRYADLIGLEADASGVDTYDALVIPGLLQTEEYARALFGTAAEPMTTAQIEDRVEVRMTRQQRLRSDNPLRVGAVIDEASIRRIIGGRDVMTAQLKHLVEMSREQHIRLWVLPLAEGVNPGAVNAFVALEFPEPTLKIAYVEELNGGRCEEDEDAERYYALYNHLRAASLPPAGSVRLIESVAKELG